jgi:hypothetical protein
MDGRCPVVRRSENAPNLYEVVLKEITGHERTSAEQSEIWTGAF